MGSPEPHRLTCRNGQHWYFDIIIIFKKSWLLFVCFCIQTIYKCINLPIVVLKHCQTCHDKDQWHAFIILIVSCTIIIVASSNLSMIASIGMQVYNSSLFFENNCACKSWDMAFLKSWFSHTFVLWRITLPSQCKINGKTMILKCHIMKLKALS